MLTFSKRLCTFHHIREVYDLIANIESYPSFIPWCNGAKIVSSEVLLTASDMAELQRMVAKSARVLRLSAPPLPSTLAQLVRSELVAELTVSFGIFLKKYLSLVRLGPPENGRALVQAVSVSGPIKAMNTLWELKELGASQTEVQFELELELHSGLTEKMIGIMFPAACDKMIKAFSERAHHLYKKK